MSLLKKYSLNAIMMLVFVVVSCIDLAVNNKIGFAVDVTLIFFNMGIILIGGIIEVNNKLDELNKKLNDEE